MGVFEEGLGRLDLARVREAARVPPSPTEAFEAHRALGCAFCPGERVVLPDTGEEGEVVTSAFVRASFAPPGQPGDTGRGGEAA
jgi:hypothetical protein